MTDTKTTPTETEIAAGAEYLHSSTTRNELRAILKNGGTICNSRRPAASVTRARQALKAAGLLVNTSPNEWTATSLGRKAWNRYAAEYNARRG